MPSNLGSSVPVGVVSPPMSLCTSCFPLNLVLLSQWTMNVQSSSSQKSFRLGIIFNFQISLKIVKYQGCYLFHVNSESGGYRSKFLLWEAHPNPESTITSPHLSCNFLSLQMCKEFILRWKCVEFQVKVELLIWLGTLYSISEHLRPPHQAGKSTSAIRVDLWMLIINIGL